MKATSMSIVVGDRSCNARCPFCISRLTTAIRIEPKAGVRVDADRFNNACRYAVSCGVNTVILTGNGEPTLFPELLTFYAREAAEHFPLVELQTNGIVLYRMLKDNQAILSPYHHDLSLNKVTTFAISCVGWGNGLQHAIMQPDGERIDLWELVDMLHDHGKSVRLSCVMFCGGVQDIYGVYEMARIAKKHAVEQLNFTPVTHPRSELFDLSDKMEAVRSWIAQYSLTPPQWRIIQHHLDENATLLLEQLHGARIYDYLGQNICLSNCLTHSTDPETMRQLIWYPDNHLRYSWEYPGAIIF
jgi:pyruvate-formate lyase-activating enzyme